MINIDYTKRPPSTPARLDEEGSNAHAKTGEVSGVAIAPALDDSPQINLRQLSGQKRKFSTAPATATFHKLGRILPAVPGRLQVTIPKKRQQPERKLTRDLQSPNACGVEESILELYHADLARHQTGTTGDPRGVTRFTHSEITHLHQHVVRQIESWRKRPITKVYRYVFLAGINLKGKGASREKPESILTAVGLDENGFPEVLGVANGAMDQDTSWGEFLQQLKRQGLFGVLLFIGDRCAGLAKRLAEIFPGVHFQNSSVQFHREFLSHIPRGRRRAMEARLAALCASSDWSMASGLIAEMSGELKRLELTAAAEFFAAFAWESMNHLAFPHAHRHLLQSNSDQLKLLTDISERSHMVGPFPDSTGPVHLVSACLRHIESTVWNEKHFARGCFC